MLVTNLNKEFIENFLMNTKQSLRIYSPWISNFGSKILFDLFNASKNIKIELYFRFSIDDIALGFVDLQGFNNLKREGCDISFFDCQDLHAKIYISDKQRVLFGSCNFTEKAFSTNYEIASLIDYNEELSSMINQWKFNPINQIQVNTMLSEVKKIPKERIEQIKENGNAIDINSKYLFYRTGLR